MDICCDRARMGIYEEAYRAKHDRLGCSVDLEIRRDAEGKSYFHYLRDA